MNQWGTRSIDWRNSDASMRWVAAEIGRRHRPAALRFLRGVPGGVTKRFWGGGARLAKMRASQFSAGLAAALEDPFIEGAVARVWCSLNADTANLVVATASLWSQIEGELDSQAWSFLASRGPLPADVIAAVTATIEYPSCIPSQLELAPAGERAVYKAKAGDSDELIELAQTRLDLLTVETLGSRVFRSCHEPFFDDALATGDYDAVVSHLVERGDRGRVGAAYYRLIEGDIDAAERISDSFLEDRAGDVDGIVLNLLVLLARGKAAKALNILEVAGNDVLARTPMLRAMLELSVDAPDRAASALCDEAYGKRSLRLYPLVLSHALLRRAGLEVPEELARVVEQGWCAEGERARAVAAIRARVRSNRRGSVQPSAAPPEDQSAEAEPANVGAAPQLAVHPDLQPIAGLAARFWSTREALEEVTEAQRWGEVGRLAADLERLQRELEDSSGELRERNDLGLSSSSPPSVASLVDSREAFDEWLLAAEAAIEANSSRRARLLESAREELQHELADAGLDEPEDLAEAKTRERVEELREEFASELAIRKSFALARTNDIRAARLDRLPPDDRLEVLRLLARVSVDAELVRFLMRDAELTDACREDAARLMLTMANTLLEAGDPVPKGVLAYLIGNLQGAHTALARDGLLNRAALTPELDVDELGAAFAGHEELLPDGLRERLQLQRALRLPPDERLSTLSSWLETRPDDEAILGALFDTLLELGRHAEAVYLGGLLARSGSEAAPEKTLRLAMERLLMSPRTLVRKPESARAILGDWSWWLELDESVVTLLYLLRAYGLDDDIINFQFSETDALEAAARRFPALVAHLLAEPSDCEPPDLQPARAVLRGLKRELARESCYTSWANASAYQVHFRRVLEQKLDALSQGRAVELPRNVDPIIDAGASHSVPPAHGKARRAMVRFLEDQLDRLRILEPTLRTVSIEELVSSGEDGRDALADEATQAEEGSVLAAVYARCVEVGE